MSERKIGEEVFIYGLGYIVWDKANETAYRELLAEIERIAPGEQPRKEQEQ